MSSAAGQRAYRIEDLSHLSGTTVRNIRAYTDRGLLPKPERHGRANVYDDTHLDRLRKIADLLERGYTLASIKELLAAWDAGTGLGDVLGVVGEVDRPWSKEKPVRIRRAELREAFGGLIDPVSVREALDLGVLEAMPGEPDTFLVPSPKELAVAAELHRAGVPMPAITAHLREVRGQVEHISERFLAFTTEYVFQRFLTHAPSPEETAEAIDLIRRLRPLAQQTVDAELARAMRMLATELIQRYMGEGSPFVVPRPAPAAPPAEQSDPRPPPVPEATGDLEPSPDAEHSPEAGPSPDPEHSREPAPSPEPEPSPGAGPVTDAVPAPDAVPGAEDVPVPLPAPTVDAVRALVGAEHVASFVAAAADREVAGRRMDAMADRGRPVGMEAGAADRDEKPGAPVGV